MPLAYSSCRAAASRAGNFQHRQHERSAYDYRKGLYVFEAPADRRLPLLKPR
jgi:hypothetical protein